MTLVIRTIALATTALAAAAAQAAPETFLGADRGLGQTQRLPAHPLADAARDAFLARLQPAVPTQTFEAISATDPVAANRSISLPFGADVAVLAGVGFVMDSPAPSTNNPINGLPSGVYPISGTRAWLSADDFTLSFTAPQVALGFYGVDIGDFNGRLTLELLFADASSLPVPASSGVVDSGGSVQYFGVLSVDRPFIAVRFGNSAPVGYDGFVFDDLTIATAAQLAPIPEPATWALWLTGVAVLGGLARRRRLT